MATIFKRGRKKNTAYTIQYLDHTGARKTVKGFTDKSLTEELAKKLESEARMRSTGLIDVQQELARDIRLQPIELHFTAFGESLEDNTAKYSRLMLNRARKVIDGCGFQNLAEIDSDRVEIFMRKMRKEEGIGNKTYNHYLQALGTFLNWCVLKKRLPSNPLRGIATLNTEVDVRHPRRALSPEEMGRLIQATKMNQKPVRGIGSELRIRLYLLAYFTGLRKSELASLTPANFRLKDSPPTVTVEAKNSKHRKKDVLPLHPDLVALLRDWLPKLGDARLFPGLARKKLSVMIQSDLKVAGIPYKNADGIADFHAAGRHTYITQLVRGGASLAEAMQLARHSEVKMTLRYTHIGLVDQAKALGNLPSPKHDWPKPKKAAKLSKDALQMRCISGDSGRPQVSPADATELEKKSRNPCENKGYGTDCHPLTKAVKMEAAGIEPASRDISTEASTRVDRNLIFAGRTPTTRIPRRLVANVF